VPRWKGVSDETIFFTIERSVARLTLNRPEKLNSFNTQMHEEVHQVQVGSG
jgi:2-(1,2-epoxy-1,2-dihydrophenyl)acetyl-CoA isomerase